MSHRSVELSRVPILNYAWVLRQDGSLWENGQLAGQASESAFTEGDTIVSTSSLVPSDFQMVTFDHVELKFYRNGIALPLTLHSVRGQVFPLIFVDENAILDVKFRGCTSQPPSGFEEIMIEQTLL